MRTSEWVQRLNLSVKRCESRPDAPTGDQVYRVKDIFTTRFGSWEPTQELGSIPQWARDTYLKRHDAPDNFDDAGGDHHLFARVLDRAGNPVKSAGLVRYWSDGFAKLGDPGYQGYVRMTPKDRSGWANQVIFSSYVPERGEIGPWCWCPEGAADVVVGGGLPANLHISTFVVWQAEPRSPGQPTMPPEGGTGGPTPSTTDFDLIRSLVWGQAGLTFSASSAFAAYARRHNLGAPLTPESEIGGYRVQGYMLGIVLAPLGQGQSIAHISW